MGKLIVIEGVDGCGKQTQSEKLYLRLKSEGKNVLKISYPRYDNPSSSLVKMYLSGEFGKNPFDVNPYVASTFFAVDRFASLKQDYEKFYQDGGILILDRYTTANMLHQASKIEDDAEKDNFLDWLWNLEFNTFGLPVPDLVFFLNIPLALSQELIVNRENKFSHTNNKDIHESNLNYLENTYNTAKKLIAKYNWIEILCSKNDNLRSIEDIHNEIYLIGKSFHIFPIR